MAAIRICGNGSKAKGRCWPTSGPMPTTERPRRSAPVPRDPFGKSKTRSLSKTTWQRHRTTTRFSKPTESKGRRTVGSGKEKSEKRRSAGKSTGLLTEKPVGDAQIYSKTRTTTGKEHTKRYENNNNRTNDLAIVCVLPFLDVGWLHMTTADGCLVYTCKKSGGAWVGGTAERALSDVRDVRHEWMWKSVALSLSEKIANTLGKPNAATEVFARIGKFADEIFPIAVQPRRATAGKIRNRPSRVRGEKVRAPTAGFESPRLRRFFFYFIIFRTTNSTRFLLHVMLLSSLPLLSPLLIFIIISIIIAANR